MKGIYDKRGSICWRSDWHFFSRMHGGMTSDVLVRKVSVGDIVVVKSEFIGRWKIVKDEDGQHYLGYIPYGFSSGGRKYTVYVVAPRNDPNNPYLALHRIRNSTNVSEVVELFK